MSDMNRASLIRQLEEYIPWNDQEAADLPVILHFLRSNKDAYLRSNLIAHMTVSAWVVNPDHSKVLMCYHKIYDSWSWLGGHCDGQEDMMAVALKEVREESGIPDPRPVSGDILSVEILNVEGHVKRGSYVPSHLHLNVTYLIEADDGQNLKICEEENSGLAWFTPQEALASSSEPWFVERIYGKLIDKVALIDKD